MSLFLVYNVEPATPSMIRSLDRHCRDRVPDGASAIDPARSDQNAVLVGNSDGVLASLADLYASGVKEPALQAEAPYLRIVVSASPGYFRPYDPDAAGTWDQDRLEAWKDAVMSHLKAEHGDDLVYAEIHLDEDTPHIHALIAPTYGKKPRKPGRQKRGETVEEFEARKAEALAGSGVRTVGRASHPELSKPGSFQRLRERMAVAVDHLGLEYGEDRSINAPPGTSTRQWVKQKAAELRAQQVAQQRATNRLEHEADELELKKVDVEIREAAVLRSEATLADHKIEIDRRRAELELEREHLHEDRVQLQMGWIDLEREQKSLRLEREEVRSMRDQLRSGLQELAALVRRGGLAVKIIDEIKDLVRDFGPVVLGSAQKPRPETPRSDRDGPGF